MAREYARNPLSIWDDAEYTDLTPAAQHLDYVLRHGPDVSWCGRVDWRPARLQTRARGWTVTAIEAAAADYEAAGFGAFDAETEEGLLRKHIRWDELLRNPKMAVAVVAAYQAVASRRLRAAVVTEVRRIRAEFPEYSSWTHPLSADKVAHLLAQPSLEDLGITNPIGNPIGNPDTNRIGNRISDADPVPITNPQIASITNPDRSETVIPTQVPNPNRNTNGITNPDRSGSPSTWHLTPVTSGGYVTGERSVAQTREPRNDPPPPERHPEHPDDWVPGCAECTAIMDALIDDKADRVAAIEPPAPHCAAHPGGTTAACGPCGDARRARQAYDAADARARSARHTAEAHRAADARAQAIAGCDLCDEHGYRGTTVCDHDPGTADRARRGVALMRAAMAGRLGPAESPDDGPTEDETPPEPIRFTSGPPRPSESRPQFEDQTREETEHA